MSISKKGTAEIISIGDELLIGQVINTNASWMAEQLSLHGIFLNRITEIGDNLQEIHQMLDEAVRRSEFILITGGLGPTADDLTKPALCSYFKSDMVFNEEAFAQIESLFNARGLTVSKRNHEQAFLPRNCIPVKNKNGTAPGMWFIHEGSYIAAMPGVPFEMQPMFSEQIIPKIKRLIKNKIYLHKTIMTTGIGESWLADRIKLWEKKLPSNIHLAYLPRPGIVRLRLSAEGTDEQSLADQINHHIRLLEQQIPELIYGYDDITLEEVIGSLLTRQNKTLGTAESCTGGSIASLITSIAGSSKYFTGTIVAYNNTIKQNLLKVGEEIIQKHGAVSQEVVESMALNAKKLLQVDYALATSGIAGPDGGTAEKPVGTVWIALAGPNGVISEKHQFGEHRGRNIHRSALAALNLLRNELISR